MLLNCGVGEDSRESLTYLFPPPAPLPSGNHLFVLCIYNYVLFIHLFCFLDSKYK